MKLFLALSASTLLLTGVQAQTFSDSTKVMLMEAQVTALRAKNSTPTTFQNLDSSALQRFDSGKDLPHILMQTPSMVVTSDAGAGIGYTGMRIRGSDATRINVTMNGIPMNDSESQGVFWVNTADLISDLNSVQIQRGVGTSTNGPGAFGASVNLNSLGINRKPYAQVRTAVGSFNSFRNTVKLGTGQLENGLSFDLRLSDIRSDGFIDRASSELRGYSAKIAWQDEVQNIQFIAFGGREKTYQAWYGVDSLSFRNNPQSNFAGAIYDSLGGIERYYDDETDNYGQDHLQLHYGRQLSSKTNLTFGLHYTRGKGYYQQYIQQGNMFAHGIQPSLVNGDSLTSTDLIRQLWLDNHFYGGVFQLSTEIQNHSIQFGGSINRYEGDHFGRLDWTRWSANSEQGNKFYDNASLKTDFNLYLKWEKQWNKWLGFADVQYRSFAYSGTGTDEGPVEVDFNDQQHFINPKFGLSYLLSDKQQLYASYALAQREGNRSDYLAGSPIPEVLHNVEAGWRGSFTGGSFQVNAYLMQYTDQLVLTGEIDNVGNFIRRNVGDSRRLGLELNGNYSINKHWQIASNFALSSNQIFDYSELQNGNLVSYDATPIAFSPSLVGGAVLNYSWKQFQASWSARYVGEQQLDNSGLARLKLDDYFLNDIRFSYNLKVKNTKGIQLTLDVFNVMDVLYASNGYVYNGFAYYYPQAGRHFMGGVSIQL